MKSDLEHPLPPDEGLAALEARMRSSGWVGDARLVVSGCPSRGANATVMLIVPNAAGLRVLRRHGKQHLFDQLLGHADALTDVATCQLELRLVEIMPQAGSEAEAQCWQLARAPTIKTIHSIGPHSLQCDVRIPHDMAIFEGHFPLIPIVPAVMQIGWAVDIAHKRLKVATRFKGVITAKFCRLVQPGMRLNLTLEYQPECAQLRFDYSFEGEAASTGRLSFGRADG